MSWLLLTSLPVRTLAEASQCLRWYTLRWRIERFHYVLKSGCRTEQLQLESYERLCRALAVFCVVAWRLTHLDYVAREAPDAPCSCFLMTDEWQALYCRIHGTPTPPSEPPDVRTAVRWIARLGGFLGRRGDGEPGVKVLWLGLQALQEDVHMWRIFHPPGRRRRLTAAAGAGPRLILQLHTPHTELRVELPGLDALATLHRAVVALHHDAQRLAGYADLQTRLFEHKPLPAALPLWRRVPPPGA